MTSLNRSLLLLAVMVAAWFGSSDLHAQSWVIDGVRCDTCWRHFRAVEDSFRIGAVGLKFPDITRDIGIDFTRLYNMGSTIGDLTRSLNDTGNHSLDRAFWKRADTLGYHVIAPMIQAGAATNLTSLQENYGYASDSVHGTAITRC